MKRTLSADLYRQHNSPDELLKYVETKWNNKTICRLTDSNTDLLNTRRAPIGKSLYTSWQSFSIVPTIGKPTGVHRSSTSLIDTDIFVNSLDLRTISGKIVSEINDHYSQYCLIRLRAENQRSKQKIRILVTLKRIKSNRK